MAISDIDAIRLRSEWGDEPCDHPDFEPEVIPEYEAKTGDLICTQCGRETSRAMPRREDEVQAARRVVDEATGERPKTKK